MKSFLFTTEDKVKLMYADEKSDHEISVALDIPVRFVETILTDCRLPIKIIGIKKSDAPALVRIMRDNKWPS